MIAPNQTATRVRVFEIFSGRTQSAWQDLILAAAFAVLTVLHYQKFGAVGPIFYVCIAAGCYRLYLAGTKRKAK